MALFAAAALAAAAIDGGIAAFHGELLSLGWKVAASTVWEIVKRAGIDSASQRASRSWAKFPRGSSPSMSSTWTRFS
ncbi:hypothetical protein ACWDA7_35240 [Streptomyces sp. NPDC001156]